MQKFRRFVRTDMCKHLSLHNEILHKDEFGQAHCVDLTKWSSTKFSLPFLDTPTSLYKFWKFANISKIK
jgi:hypothetical protein